MMKTNLGFIAYNHLLDKYGVVGSHEIYVLDENNNIIMLEENLVGYDSEKSLNVRWQKKDVSFIPIRNPLIRNANDDVNFNTIRNTIGKLDKLDIDKFRGHFKVYSLDDVKEYRIDDFLVVPPKLDIIRYVRSLNLGIDSDGKHTRDEVFVSGSIVLNTNTNSYGIFLCYGDTKDSMVVIAQSRKNPKQLIKTEWKTLNCVLDGFYEGKLSIYELEIRKELTKKNLERM